MNELLVNNGRLVNSRPLPVAFRYMYTQGWPSDESLTNYVALLWVEVSQHRYKVSPSPYWKGQRCYSYKTTGMIVVSSKCMEQHPTWRHS